VNELDEEASLPKPVGMPPVEKIYGTAVETGKIQVIPNPTDIPLPAAGLTIRVGSDLDVIPEPSSWILGSLGAVGLGCWLVRRAGKMGA
jgi:hypothetical protein